LSFAHLGKPLRLEKITKNHSTSTCRRRLHMGIVAACHRGDWSNGSRDRIPPGARRV
jgi:hypothetical protein